MDPEEYGELRHDVTRIYTHCRVDQLMEGLERVRIAIGSPEQSGFSDQEVKDALYYYQYDVDKSVDYLIGMPYHFPTQGCSNLLSEEQDRKRAAQERRGGSIVDTFHLIFPSLSPPFPRAL